MIYLIKFIHFFMVFQENLCAHRGLVANTDAQTFRMSLPLALRSKYDEIFRIRNERVRQ